MLKSTLSFIKVNFMKTKINMRTLQRLVVKFTVVFNDQAKYYSTIVFLVPKHSDETVYKLQT